MRVVYIPANPPSPVPEEAEEENESLDSDVDQEVERPSMSNPVSTIVLLLNAVSNDAVLVPSDDWCRPLFFRHQSMNINLDRNLHIMR
jgi:hypothetical protein